MIAKKIYIFLHDNEIKIIERKAVSASTWKNGYHANFSFAFFILVPFQQNIGTIHGSGYMYMQAGVVRLLKVTKNQT